MAAVDLVSRKVVRVPEVQGHHAHYEADRPRTEAARRLLGRDVALMLVDNRDPVGVLRAFPTASVRPVESVPLSYVVEAADPLEALRIAGAIRNAPGVRAAYPLLRRTYATR